MARSVPEWVGRSDDSMPGVHVHLRLYDKQNGLCACGCGITMNLERDAIDCDHIVPLRDEGKNVESNLQLMLRDHHKGKTRAENIARGKERQHKAKAFTALRKPSSFPSRGFEPRPKQRSATRPIVRRSEQV